MPRLVWALLAVLPAWAQQNPCAGTPAWSPCDWAFDLAPNESPDTFDLRAEFRSPHHRTYLLYAFRDADRRFVIRFSPTEDGQWDYRLTSSAARLDGQAGQFTAAASGAPGFVRPANVHHFATENNKPHLWMATVLDGFLSLPRPELDRIVEQHAGEKFTHLRVTLDSGADLREAADRIRAINSRGLVADLVLAAIPADAAARRKYVSDLASRFSALNVTWAGMPDFERLPRAKVILKDTGEILKQFDPYNHPRTSMADTTSAALAGDQWMTVRSYGTLDPNVGAVEQQLYATPAVNTAIRSQRDLWNATMNGQYPASGSGPYMTAWFDFMSGNRHWELEPYFDVDGGRALALEGVEYVVYVEKPGPVEVTVENHGYDVAWIDPATGERTKAKDYKGEHFTGEPPDKSHDWVLHISREGTKQSMIKSYFFDSREIPIQLQQVESNAQKTPFTVAAPAEGALSLARPPRFSLKITRDSRATRSLLVEWTGEVTAAGEGYRVMGSGREGSWSVPPNIQGNPSGSMVVRVYIMNAYGKVYEIDRVYRLAP